ncbi:MAG: SAM-dependent methyltransferase [Nocardioides sp.]|nr:SAM-dependent methyltransferase [Nocardioides sp.]
MSAPLPDVLAVVRGHLLGPDTLVRAVASGRRRSDQPRWKRVEVRYVDLRAGRRLQVTSYDETQAFTANYEVRPDVGHSPAAVAVDELLAEPFGNWHVETTTEQHQVRVTKKLEGLLHTSRRTEPAEVDRGHDRDKDRLLPEDDPVFRALGLADANGRLKPSRQAKYRQVEEFLRLLDSSLTDALDKGHLRTPTAEDPLRIVDLGCGNAYLTFAAQRYLTGVRGVPVHLVGVDVREQSREHNAGLAAELGVDADFVVGSIAGVALEHDPEVVLALHACDTATDEALARAVGWDARLVLAAPCCHHDIAAQLRATPAPAPYSMLTRDGILRERLADTLTDALRASLLRAEGYRVDVVQFVESQHTPRNTMLRAVRTGTPAGSREEYDDLVATWHLAPRLAELLGTSS